MKSTTQTALRLQLRRPERCVPPCITPPCCAHTQLTASIPCACQAANGRRVRVYWPDDDAWFTGTVRRFDPRTGLHTVCYDDGDREQLMLAVERFEWLGDSAGAAPSRLPPTSRLASASLAAAPSRGTRTLVRKEQTGGADPSQDAEWPRVGDLVWGHVKVCACLPQLPCSSHLVAHLPPCVGPPRRRDTAGGLAASWTAAWRGKPRWRRAQPWLSASSTTPPAGSPATGACRSWRTSRRCTAARPSCPRSWPPHGCVPSRPVPSAHGPALTRVLTLAQMARRAWNEMQASLAPAEEAMPLAEMPVPKRLLSSLGTAGARVTRLGARRLGTATRPRAASHRAGRHVVRRGGAASGRMATRRAGLVSLHGVAVDLGGMTRRLAELDARLNPLVSQAQAAVVAQLRLLPVCGELSKASSLCEEVEMQQRKLLLSQLVTLHTVMPRIRGELVELELAHGQEALPAYLTPPPVSMRRAPSVSRAEQHAGGVDGDAGVVEPADEAQPGAEAELDPLDVDDPLDDAGMDEAPYLAQGAETSSSHSEQ